MSVRRICIACILAAALAACNRDPGLAPLAPADQELVDELVAEYEARLMAIAAADSSAQAEATRTPELESRLDALGLDPARGARVLLAVHDSLARFRDTLLRATESKAAP